MPGPTEQSFSFRARFKDELTQAFRKATEQVRTRWNSMMNVVWAGTKKIRPAFLACARVSDEWAQKSVKLSRNLQEFAVSADRAGDKTRLKLVSGLSELISTAEGLRKFRVSSEEIASCLDKMAEKTSTALDELYTLSPKDLTSAVIGLKKELGSREMGEGLREVIVEAVMEAGPEAAIGLVKGVEGMGFMRPSKKAAIREASPEALEAIVREAVSGTVRSMRPFTRALLAIRHPLRTAHHLVSATFRGMLYAVRHPLKAMWDTMRFTGRAFKGLGTAMVHPLRTITNLFRRGGKGAPEAEGGRVSGREEGVLGAMLGKFSHHLIRGAASVGSVIVSFRLLSQAMAPVADFLQASFMPLFVPLQQVMYRLVSDLQPFIAEIGPKVMGVFIQLADAVRPVIFQVVPQLADALLGIVPALMPVVDMIGKLLIVLADNFVPVIETLIGALRPVIEKVFPTVINLVETILTGFAPLLTMLANFASTLMDALVPVMVTLVDALTPIVRGLLPPLIDLVGLLLDIATPIIKIAAEFVTLLMKGVGPVLVFLVDKIAWMIKTITTVVRAGLGWLFGLLGIEMGATGAMRVPKTPTKVDVVKLPEEERKMYKAMTEHYKGLFEERGGAPKGYGTIAGFAEVMRRKFGVDLPAARYLQQFYGTALQEVVQEAAKSGMPREEMVTRLVKTLAPKIAMAVGGTFTSEQMETLRKVIEKKMTPPKAFTAVEKKEMLREQEAIRKEATPWWVHAEKAARFAIPIWGLTKGIDELLGLQHGGIVRRPSLVRVAEKGPERVEPLESGFGFSGGMTGVMSAVASSGRIQERHLASIVSLLEDEGESDLDKDLISLARFK